MPDSRPGMVAQQPFWPEPCDDETLEVQKGVHDEVEPRETEAPTPAMPITMNLLENPSTPVQQHREKLNDPYEAQFYSMVAKSLPLRDAERIPAAKAALESEWKKLWDIKCWMVETVCEYDEVRNKAAKSGRTAHFGRVFPIVVEKGSELPPDQRKYKGRVVFQGNNVHDQENNMAVFNDLQSSACLMVAGKFMDVIGAQPGNTIQQSDAQQAYTQAILGGDETWIFLPRDQWPKTWSKFRNPVCRLRLALYGHPLSGAYWEKHCDEKLREIGFEKIPEWESCYIHKKLKLVLLVYVDDFKMAGDKNNMAAGWKSIHTMIKMDDPTPIGKFLGCGHSTVQVPYESMIPQLAAAVPLT